MGLRVRRPAVALAAVAALIVAGLATISAASAQVGCDPIQTQPV